MTVFGDSLLPYTSEVRSGALSGLLAPFGINAQLTRTSSFRLAEDGWLTARREGRGSIYSLTESGRLRVEDAAHRIYDPPVQFWDGEWTILFTEAVGARKSQNLGREREWAGFGKLGTRTFLKPGDLPSGLREMLARLEMTKGTAVLRARPAELQKKCAAERGPAGSLVAECWNLPGVAKLYQQFLEHHRPVLDSLQREVAAETAYVAQTLVIHAFRRVVLHDPRLPAALLPDGWPGQEAFGLCRSVYLQTHRHTRAFLATHLDRAGSAMKPNPAFRRRFGGLS